MTKKALLLFIFILILNVLINIKKPETIPVFSESNSNNYNVYLIDLNDLNITTKNLLNKFPYNIKIIGIYPKINNIYNYKLKNEIGYYKFNNKTTALDITNFINTYTKTLNKYGLVSEVVKIQFNGIGIKQIQIYCSQSDLGEILNKNPKFKILKSQF